MTVEQERTAASPSRADGADTFGRELVGRVKRADEELVGIVREHPFAAVVAALALGYTIGRVLSRRG